MEDYNGTCTIKCDSLASAYCHDHNSTWHCDTVDSVSFKSLYYIRQQLASYVDMKSEELDIHNHFYIYAIGNDGYKNLLYISKDFPFAIYHVYNLHLYHEPCFYQSHILNVSGLGNMYGTYSEAKKWYIRNHGI
jgi:hypothetical protein